MKLNTYFKVAKQLSYKSDHRFHQHGSCIKKGKSVIGFGWNQLKTHRKAPSFFHSIHAEFHATLGLRPAELAGAEIYVYREHKNGNLANSKPCNNCLLMIRSLGIKKVWFTIENGISNIKL